jgi:hypothetical protein
MRSMVEGRRVSAVDRSSLRAAPPPPPAAAVPSPSRLGEDLGHARRH